MGNRNYIPESEIAVLYCPVNPSLVPDTVFYLDTRNYG